MENNLPQGWAEIELSEITDFKKGKKPKKMQPTPFKGSLVYLDIKAIEKGNDEIFVDCESSNYTDGNDLIVVWDGARAGWVAKSRLGAIGSTIMSLTPKIHKDYLLRYLQTQFNYIHSNHRGTGIPHVDPDIFWNIKIPIAPIQEQHRIVAKLDAVMQKVESNKQRIDKIPKLLKRFRQSVLSAAVSGKLTEDWRVENKPNLTVDELINYINDLRDKKYKAVLKKATELNLRKPKKPTNLKIEKIYDDNFSIPEEWALINLEYAASINQYSMSSGPFGSALGTKDYKENGIIVIRGQNIQNGIFVESNFVYISKEKAIELKRSAVKEGDLVVVAVGSSGQVALIPKSIEGSIMSQNCNKISLDGNLIENVFVLKYLQNSIAISQLKDKTTDTARPFLSLTNLKSIIIPLPPLEEQKEIVRRVEQLFAFADKIEARYTKAKTMLDKLPQSILAKAFRGELVPQDPNDEPASVLLERIKAEKEKLAEEKKGKKTKAHSKKQKPLKIAAKKKVKYKKTTEKKVKI